MTMRPCFSSLFGFSRSSVFRAFCVFSVLTAVVAPGFPQQSNAAASPSIENLLADMRAHRGRAVRMTVQLQFKLSSDRSTAATGSLDYRDARHLRLQWKSRLDWPDRERVRSEQIVWADGQAIWTRELRGEQAPYYRFAWPDEAAGSRPSAEITTPSGIEIALGPIAIIEDRLRAVEFEEVVHHRAQGRIPARYELRGRIRLETRELSRLTWAGHAIDSVHLTLAERDRYPLAFECTGPGGIGFSIRYENLEQAPQWDADHFSFAPEPGIAVVELAAFGSLQAEGARADEAVVEESIAEESLTEERATDWKQQLSNWRRQAVELEIETRAQLLGGAQAELRMSWAYQSERRFHIERVQRTWGGLLEQERTIEQQLIADGHDLWVTPSAESMQQGQGEIIRIPLDSVSGLSLIGQVEFGNRYDSFSWIGPWLQWMELCELEPGSSRESVQDADRKPGHEAGKRWSGRIREGIEYGEYLPMDMAGQPCTGVVWELDAQGRPIRFQIMGETGPILQSHYSRVQRGANFPPTRFEFVPPSGIPVRMIDPRAAAVEEEF